MKTTLLVATGGTPMRLSAGLALALTAAVLAVPARAELTCDQVGALSSQTIEARDRGVSLTTMLAEMDRREVREKFTPEEIRTMRETIRVVFMSEAWPKEVMEACHENEKVREKQREKERAQKGK